MSATYDLPLSVHMEAKDDSVAGMERLLASNREGTWIWAHTGHSTDTRFLRRLLTTHPNLYLELSNQLSLMSDGNNVRIDVEGQLRSAWKEFLEDFPDRFVIGTDREGKAFLEDYTAYINFWRDILNQLSSEAAMKLAHQNAQRLLGLPET